MNSFFFFLSKLIVNRILIVFFNKIVYYCKKKKKKKSIIELYGLCIVRVLVQESTGAFNPFWQTCSTFNFCILQYAFVT